MPSNREIQKVVEELHKVARRNYPRRKFDVRGLDETWQADLIDMKAYSRENKGYKYLLTIIDVFSKFAWAIPAKSKSGEDITIAMKSVLVQGRVPKNLQVDLGSEFYNVKFKLLMQKYKIKLYSSFSNLKASIVERFNRTLKTWMWKEFSLRGSYKWFDILPDLMERYNNKVHRTIGMKPQDVNSENEAIVLRKFLLAKNATKKKIRPKFKIGDRVRISKNKGVFTKGYLANWSPEIFTITRVAKTQPVTYHLKDYKDETIAGGFYEQEIAHVMYPDVYLVEKIIKRRKNQVYVKWLGFDDSHNSWIDKD